MQRPAATPLAAGLLHLQLEGAFDAGSKKLKSDITDKLKGTT